MSEYVNVEWIRGLGWYAVVRSNPPWYRGPYATAGQALKAANRRVAKTRARKEKQ